MNMRTTVLKTWFLWIIGLLCVAPFQPLRAKDFVVVIDAGHGGHDAGAIGSFSKEKNINLSVALAVGKQLERDYSGIKVIFTRKTDVFVTLQGRAQIANKNKADLFVSIHTNAAAKGNTAQGTETYTLGLHRTQENLEVAKKENSVILIEDDYKTRYAGFNPNSSESYIMFEFMQDKNMKQSVQLATNVQKEFKNTAHRADRGVRQAGFLVLHATTMPSVLIELGYISTPHEERYLNSSEGVAMLSKSISKAIAQYSRSQGHATTYTAPAEPIPSESAALPESEEEAPHAAKEPVEAPETPTRGEAPARSEAPAKTDSSARKQEAAQHGTETGHHEASERHETSGQNRADATNNQTKKENNKPIFKIQILTASSPLKENDKRFKGLKPVSYYKENGIYKYTYGESTDYNEVLRLKRKITEQFKDSFIIAFRRGEKMNVQEAIQEFKRNR